MKKPILLAASFMVFSFSLSSFAAGSIAPGPYFNIHLGYSKPKKGSTTVSPSGTNPTNGYTLNSEQGRRFAWGSGVGYNYRASPSVNMGLEFNFDSLGGVNQTITPGDTSDYSSWSSKSELYAFDFFFTASYQKEKFGGYVKAGYSKQYLGSSDESGADSPYNEYNQQVVSGWLNWVPTAAVGLSYNFYEHIAIYTEYKHSFGKQAAEAVINGKGIEVDSISLGLSYSY